MKQTRNSKKFQTPVQVRQGDVFLNPAPAGFEVPASDSPARVKPVNGRTILAYGEVTGHHHSLTAETTNLFSIDGKTVLVVDEPTKLQHQEHGTIEIAPGTYFVTIQREYTPAEIRRVVD